MAFLRLQKRLLGESETLQKNDFFWALKILCGLKKNRHTYISFTYRINDALHNRFINSYSKIIWIAYLKST